MWGWHPKHNVMLKTLQFNIWDVYEEYIHLCNHKEHSRKTFEELVQNFDVAKMEPIQVEWNGSKFMIRDGCHRLAILMAKGIVVDTIPIYFLDCKLSDGCIRTICMSMSDTTGYTIGNGWCNRTTYGYHSIQLFNMNIIGQRNCIKRILKMKEHYDFKNKVVMDVGCNIGGMLHFLLDAKRGIGVDIDRKCIDVGRIIQRELQNIVLPCEFYEMNLEHTHEFETRLQTERPDCIFLLSLGSWIRNWKELYKLVCTYVDTFFLETNNNQEGVAQLDYIQSLSFQIHLIKEKSDDDMTGNDRRQLYICTKVY
jgi:hypothetical protein